MTHVQKNWTAAEVYKRLDDVNPEDVKKLEEWCKKHTNIAPPNLTEEQLILFLHSCYSNFENTKKCVTEYYHLRRKATQFFKDRDIKSADLNKSLNKFLMYGVFKPKTPEGYRVVFHKLRDFEPSNYSFNDGFKLLAMATETIYIRDGPNDGVILLFDMAGVKLGHVTRLPLGSVKKCLEYIQDANPVRLKGIHVLNVHPVIDKIMMIVRPFIRKQLLSLLHFHKENDESVYDVVPKSCLPAEYGGDLESLDTIHDEFIAEMEELRPLFVEEERILTQAFKSLKDKNNEKDIDLSKLDID